MTPEEIREKCPIMDVTGVIGGLWADREGYLDTTGTVHAYAGAARKRGATVIEHNKVEALNPRADGTWEVVTEKGVIHAEHVVNAGGLWAKQVGRMVGLDLPLSPLQHHYFVTETIPEVAALDFEVPMTVDLEGFTYLRQDQQGVLVGIYEVDHKHWNIDGATVGLRLRSHPGGDRPNRRRARDGLAPLPGAGAGGSEAVGQRRLHLLPGRQPPGRAGTGAAQLLARLRGDGRVPPGRRSRQVARGVDDPRRGGGRRVADGHRALRNPSRRTGSTSGRPPGSSTRAAS